MKTDIRLDSTMSLKINSCYILHHLILDQIKEKVPEEKILPYVKQWVTNCTKTVEFDINNTIKEVEVYKP